LASILGYELNSSKAHKQIASLYLGDKELSEEEYKHAKQVNFQAIYGTIPEQYSDTEFFVRIAEYTNSLWDAFKDKGYVKAPQSMKRFTSKIGNMNPQKLMNYIIQCTETTRNVTVLKEVLKYLSHKKSDIVLYTYDSIVLDFNKEDGEEILTEIEDLLTIGNYPIGIKTGSDLSFQS